MTPDFRKRSTHYLTLFKPIAIAAAVAVSQLVFPSYAISFLLFVLLAVSSPAHAALQALLCILYAILVSTSTAAVLADEALLRAMQATIFLIMLAFGDYAIRPDATRLARWLSQFARPVLHVAAWLTIVASAFRSCPVWTFCWAPVCWIYLRRLALPAEPFSRRVAKGTANALVLCVSLGFSLGLIEFGARMYLPEPVKPLEMYDTDNDAIFTLRPNGKKQITVLDNDNKIRRCELAISSQGIRDREYGPKKPDEFRIVVLGDSYTMGYGLTQNETYPRRLEAMLNGAHLPVHVTVINCGVAGFSPLQERSFLKKRALQFQPDLVLLQLFPPNDVSGSYARTGKLLRSIDVAWERRMRTFRRQAEFSARCERWLQTNSNAYATCVEVYNSDGLVMQVLSDFRFFPPVQYPRLVSKSDRNSLQEVCLQNWYPELEEAWKCYSEDLAGIAADCRERKLDLIAFCHGDMISLRKDGWDKLNADFPGTPYEMNKDIKMSDDLLHTIGVPTIDVLGYLQACDDPRSIYYVNDGHFTPLGANLVAACVADYLLDYYLSERLHILPPPPASGG